MIVLGGRFPQRWPVPQTPTSSGQGPTSNQDATDSQELQRLVVCSVNTSEIPAPKQELKQQWHELQDVDSPLRELTKALSDQRLRNQQVGELHLIAHGSSQGIQLNGEWIDAEMLLAHAAELAQWQIDSLVLWCCHIGQNQTFLSILEELTGAEVFSSPKAINRNNHKVVSQNGEARELHGIQQSGTRISPNGHRAASP